LPALIMHLTRNFQIDHQIKNLARKNTQILNKR